MTLRLFALLMPLALCAAQDPKPAAGAKAAETKKEEPKKEEAAAPAADKAWTGWIEVGARWQSGVAGNMNAYRSVVNLTEGFRMPSMDISYQGVNKAVKTMRLTAGQWGDPYNTARLEVSDEKYYRYTSRYSNLLYFNTLPSFANLAAPAGFNWNSRDTNVRNFNNELQILPSERFTPYVRIDRNWSNGTGIAPLVANANEYPLRTNIDWYQQDLIGGIRMNFTKSHVTVEHGATDFGDAQSVYATEKLTGARTAPMLGQQLFLNSGSQIYDVVGSSRITKVLFTANPYNWVDLYGQVLYGNPKTTSKFTQNVAGNLYSPQMFYTSGKDTVFGNAMRPHTSGSFGTELRPFARLRLRETFETDRIKTDTTGTIESIYVKDPTLSQTLAASAADRLETSLSRQTVEALYDITRKFTVRGGYRYEWGDALIRAGAFSITGPQERLQLERHIGLAGFSARPFAKLSLNGSAEISDGRKSYYRTSLMDYYRLKLMGRYDVTKSIQLNAAYHRMVNENPAPDVKSQFKSENATLGIQYLPEAAKWITVMAEYNYGVIRSDLGYLVLFPYQQLQSQYRDRASTGTVLVNMTAPGKGLFKPQLTIGGSYVTTSGSRPTRYYQPEGRVSIPLHRNIQVFSEWRNYGYNQPGIFNYETFRTHMVMTGVRFVL